MSGSTKVAIITPTYNRAHTIVRAVESVLAQTHRNWELIIRDDGSRDNTAEVLAPYLTDARIRYLPRVENKGVNTTRNEALDVMSDDVNVVTFLDSDDTLVPDALATALSVMAAEPTIIGLTSQRRMKRVRRAHSCHRQS